MDFGVMSQPLDLDRYRVHVGATMPFAQRMLMDAGGMSQPLHLGRFRVDDSGFRRFFQRLLDAGKSMRMQPVVIQPRCPLRQRIVGPYRARNVDNDPVQIARVALIGLCVGVATVTLAHTHDTWMFYVELLISLCT